MQRLGVQGFVVVPQSAQAPREVRARHDLVVFRASSLQFLEPLAYRAHGALRMADDDLEPLDVARDVPGSELLASTLGDGPSAFEEAQCLPRLRFHRRGIARIER
jgi:hypothetical protein